MSADFRRHVIAAALAFAAALPAIAQDDSASAGKTFKVCRNPNNLPFSNSKSEGYEDKIAELLAADLGRKVEYYEFASPFNFIRNTLKFKLPGDEYHCDVVIAVPAGFDQVAQTKPYFRSTYALVIPQGRKLDKIRTVDDFLALPAATLDTLRVGVVDRSPASDWLVNHGLLDIGVPYKLLVADVTQTSGGIVEDDLRAGKIDAAIVWGPIAGYYAKRSGDVKELVIPLKSEKGVKFEFDFAMGLRFGEKEWKQQLETLIDRNRPKILAILADYGVPVVEDSSPKAAP